MRPEIVHAVAVLRGVGARHAPLTVAQRAALETLERAYGAGLHQAARARIPDERTAEDEVRRLFARLPWELVEYREGELARWLVSRLAYADEPPPDERS